MGGWRDRAMVTGRWMGQQLLAPGADARIGERMRALLPDAGELPSRLMLDLGSGSESRLSRLGTRTVAVDISRRCASAAARAGALAIVASADALPFRDNCFGAAVGVGLLHHLSDDRASGAVREMSRVTAPGGVIIVIDAVIPEPPWKRPVAAIIRYFDRGRWMRRQEAIESLLDGAWTRDRFTYARTGLEALVALRRKACP